jgi:hypothetical protein
VAIVRFFAEKGWRAHLVTKPPRRLNGRFLSMTMTKHLADGEGFEPSVPCGTHAFQACPIDRSGTHPKRAYEFGVDCQRLQPEISSKTAGAAVK